MDPAAAGQAGPPAQAEEPSASPETHPIPRKQMEIEGGHTGGALAPAIAISG